MGSLLTRFGSYESALDFLFQRLSGTTRLGLEHTRALLAELGDPHLAVPAIHVAGTNGKGSTVATLDALLRAQGLVVGRYTSPHLVDFRERIAVNGAFIEPSAVVSFLETHIDAIERIGATFFEVTTALAFQHFAERRVDIALIETGLGGRLDSTNVIVPVAAVVTTIGIDHVEYLGHTLQQIAREKAGIFKAGVPAVIGEPDPEISGQLCRLAASAGATPVRALLEEGTPREIGVSGDGTSFSVSGAPGQCRRLRVSLIGRHQAWNASLALLVLDTLGPRYAMQPRELAEALARVQVPGRFERRERFIFDVAHNPDGAAMLARTLASVRPAQPVVALFGVLADKDWRAMLEPLAPHVSRFVFTAPPSAPASRAWNPDDAAAYAAERGWSAAVEHDLERAMANAEQGSGTVLVTGSFHTVGDVMARLPAARGAG